MKVLQVRNMSQSSGAPGGFNVNKAQINERLQLLKSTFKYKNQSEHDTASNIGDNRTFDNTERRLKYDATTGKKANSEYNMRQDFTKLPAVLNNNNYMMQTGGAGGSSQGGSKIIDKPQQTHNSFGLSNVSTNVNNNFNAAKSYSANKQLQSTNTTGYNFGGGARRDLSKHYNAYQSDMQNNNLADNPNNSSNLGFSNMDKSVKGYGAINSVKGTSKGPIKAVPIPAQDYMNTIQVGQQNSATKNSIIANDLDKYSSN